MRGFIAITDLGWAEHLARRPQPTEANFWKPSVRRLANLAPGTPFLFKLRAPHNAIAGFGYFATFSILPDWLAWETFGEANGASSLDELRARLSRVQKGADIEPDPSGRIGCSLIAEATLFPRDEWIPQPQDWKAPIQSGEGYDLTTGEGLRVWQECLSRVAQPAPLRAAGPDTDRPRFGSPAIYLPRLGQGIFRVEVLDAYGRACAITGEHSLPVLEAAHIKPYASGGEHEVTNGLSLRSDLHKLFDRGYVTVDEALNLVVGKRLKADFDNGRSYYGLHGSPLALPPQVSQRPSAEALEWHRTNRYLG